MARKTIVAGTAIFAVAGGVLAGSVYAFVWFRWHHEVHLVRYVVVVAALPLLAAVVSGHRAYVVPGALLALGGLMFWAGVLANGSPCQQPGPREWAFRYLWRENAVYFGRYGTLGPGYLCVIDPNTPVALLGYLLTATGVAGLTLSETRSRINTSWRVLVE